ncbi:hypothetical protein [Acidiphilium rubrum]|uniref:hypothetical protein n=1 Tax=Acidiphilium rubrum TaxID=526 RepID=UPI002B8DBCA6|nr:hypothetical protein [Acidiphilium rubrum]HQT86525.1 hypothetical protein [Acidiphilium rubrum]
MSNFASRVGRERVAEIGVATNRLAPVIFKNQPAERAATSKPAASTSSRGAKANTTNFAHLAPCNDPHGFHRAADANRATRVAVTAEQAADDADRATAMRIIAAGQARRGELAASPRRTAAAAPVAQSERADRNLAMMIVEAGKARRGEI